MGAAEQVHGCTTSSHMLGGEDLDGMIERRRSADSVCPGFGLRPRCPLLKAHLTRQAHTYCDHQLTHKRFASASADGNDVPRILVETSKASSGSRQIARSQGRTRLRPSRARWASAALVPLPGLGVDTCGTASPPNCRAPDPAFLMTLARPRAPARGRDGAGENALTGSVMTSIATHGFCDGPVTALQLDDLVVRTAIALRGALALPDPRGYAFNDQRPSVRTHTTRP